MFYLDFFCYYVGPQLYVSCPQGATDSEKRVLCLSAENESLKQSLSVTQGLLQQLSTIPSQSSTMLIKVRGTSTAESSLMTDIQFRPSYTCNLLCFRKMRTSVAECSSWSSPFSSVRSSCRKWSDGVNKPSGEEARS